MDRNIAGEPMTILAFNVSASQACGYGYRLPIAMPARLVLRRYCKSIQTETAKRGRGEGSDSSDGGACLVCLVARPAFIQLVMSRTAQEPRQDCRILLGPLQIGNARKSQKPFSAPGTGQPCNTAIKHLPEDCGMAGVCWQIWYILLRLIRQSSRNREKPF